MDVDVTYAADHVTDSGAEEVSQTAGGEVLTEESLVEEVSIDGMCGVY